MAKRPISLLLMRRLILTFQSPKPAMLLRSVCLSLKPYSTSAPLDQPKTSSLSARMSYVFDQIDAIERERVEKHETLQRIRAWRQSKETPQQQQQQNTEALSTPKGETIDPQGENLESRSGGSVDPTVGVELNVMKKKKELEVVHPWPEWIELMERLVQQNYFDHKRINEDRMVKDLGFNLDEDGNDGGCGDDDIGIDLKDYKTVQTACLNFGKDRFDILRSLSRKDIQVFVGYGCPSVDNRIVFSAKLLRKHAHLDEGDVCSSCSLRSSCERAYLLTNKEDEARTIDVMRVLLAYSFDPTGGLVSNKAVLKQKSVKTVVRKLLHEVVKLSAVPIDPNLPPPVIRKPPPKVKQPPPPPRKRVGRDDVEMKKGDWLCGKCDFMNFAKNTVCLRCDAKRPKRQLLPGEWECPECQFLNYRRNTVCFHCECKRPPETFMEDKMEERQYGHRTRPEKPERRSEVSNAWNFDFDDDESDGADVAAFEYANSVEKGEDSPLVSPIPRVYEREYSGPDHARPRMGFDDFDDEDDVDSYEVDTQNNGPAWKASQGNFDEREVSDLDDIEASNANMQSHLKRGAPPYAKPSRPKSRKPSFSASDVDELDIDSDDELSAHSKWKSSHISDSRRNNKGRLPTGPSRGLSFGSDEDLEFDSDVDDDLVSHQRKGNGQGSGRKSLKRSSSFEDVSFSSSDSANDRRGSWGIKSRSNEMDSGRRANNFRDRGNNREFIRDAGARSKGKTGDRRNSWNDNFDGSVPRSHGGNNRGFRGNDRAGQRMTDRGSGSWSSNRQEGFRQKRERSREYLDMDKHAGEFRNSRRVIER
uniref:DNA polymerase n=1 Tax=Rhizophora mucronata TaxID=61149 RepID=A0A2P2IUY3_RHIMU